jgi:hypothetical protein
MAGARYTTLATAISPNGRSVPVLQAVGRAANTSLPAGLRAHDAAQGRRQRGHNAQPVRSPPHPRSSELCPSTPAAASRATSSIVRPTLPRNWQRAAGTAPP